MAFQSTVNIYNTIGVVGDFAKTGPQRAETWNLTSSGQAQTIGSAFTQTSGGNPNPVPGSPVCGTAQVGGTGNFAGILVNSKEYALYGTTTGGPLAASLNLPDGAIGSLATMGYVFVNLTTIGNVGDFILYDNTTGALASQARSSSFTGVVATNTLTVTSFVTGGAPLAIGTVISGTGVTPGTVISALGSGTGGNGTYTVTGAATVASATMTGNSIAPTGKTFVPNAVIDGFDMTATGIAIIKLTTTN